MLIKNDKQVALDQVNRLLRLSSHQYDDASRRIEDPALSDWFAQLAIERAHYSEQFEERIRQAGELPNRPDPDKELVSNLLEEIREIFTSDHIPHELHQRALLETALETALEQASRLNDETAMAELIAMLQRHVATVRNRIKDLLPA